MALLAACSGAPPPVPRPAVAPPRGVPAAERGYLLDPLEGYVAQLSAERRQRIAMAWSDLVEQADGAALAGARRLARDLAQGDPEFPPARVLAGEADFVARLGGEPEPVDDPDGRQRFQRLAALADAFPAYTAVQMLLGRTAERLGDLPRAYAAYRAVAAKNPLALRRTGELHPRALEIVGNRLREALKGSRLDEAVRLLALLQAWAPADTATFEAARAVAEARNDLKAELAAIKNLAERRVGERELLERRSALELEVGDPTVGLKIAQDLADKNPRDARLGVKLASAKFLWRLSTLPQKVRDVAAKPDLSRADLAVLLFWLVPEVRYAHPSEGRIATDVLDHPQREEIVRVVNLGLIEVDDTLHRFSPGAPARRGTVLRSLVRILGRFVAGGLPCLGDGAANPQPSARYVCDAALRCGLTDGGDECPGGDAVTGKEAIEMIRRALVRLGRS